jgi:hypothetical protein
MNRKETLYRLNVALAEAYKLLGPEKTLAYVSLTLEAIDAHHSLLLEFDPIKRPEIAQKISDIYARREGVISDDKSQDDEDREKGAVEVP